MSTTSDLRKGLAVQFKGNPCLITEAQFVSPGKGSAFTRCKLKNLKNGQIVEMTFKSGEAFEVVDVSYNKCQYLYTDGVNYFFMNNDTYDQFSLGKDSLGDLCKYLLDGTECFAMYLDGVPISIQLPPKMDFKIISTSPGVRGDTATGGSKEAVIEGGAVIKVPLFIEEGEVIKINIEEGTYVSKA